MQTRLLLLAALGASSSFAFDLKGTVSDNGTALAGVRVGLVGARATALTDAQGKFDLNATTSIRGNTASNLNWSFRGRELSLRSASPIVSVRLLSTDGRVVLSRTPEATSLDLSLTGLSEGFRILEVRTTTSVQRLRLGLGSRSGSLSATTASGFAARGTGIAPASDTLCVYLPGRLLRKVPVTAGQNLSINLPTGAWISGDFHTHTFLSDGSHTEVDVVAHAFGGTYSILDTNGTALRDTTVPGYNLQWMANCDHGGAFNRTPFGKAWANVSPAPTMLGSAVAAGNMWRWQSLLEYSWPIVDSLDKVYAAKGKTLIQGYEWNVPSHEHASVGVYTKVRKVLPGFEFLFDESDKDTAASTVTTLGLPGAKDTSKTHAKAVAAMAWLQQNLKDSSYVLINHPSRKLKFTAAHLRDFQDAAPDVFVGIEAMPGHQKEAFRAGYSSSFANKADSLKARTYGGTDYMLARVGGLADALWSEGRPLWVFSNSDFHSSSEANDFWPGEFNRNWTLAEDSSFPSVLKAMKSGTGFALTGDLVSSLDFTADDGVVAARMGGTLRTGTSDSVTLTIRFAPTAKNGRGYTPLLHHIDVISGTVGAKAAVGTPGYAVDTAANVKIVATIPATGFTALGNGQFEVTVRVAATGSAYYRLRGTNLAQGTAGQTDAAGNPLGDFEMGPNTPAMAFQDLWLYTNPVFVLR